LIAHGTNDMLVPYEFGQYAREALEKLDYTVKWLEYPMEHNICSAEIQDISKWLQQLLEQADS
jgi:phospholipase/carboxylesterase